MFKKLLLSCIFSGISCLNAFDVTGSQPISVQDETNKDQNVVINVNSDESVKLSYIEIRYESDYYYTSDSDSQNTGSITYKTSSSSTNSCTFGTLNDLDRFCQNFRRVDFKTADRPKNVFINVVTSFTKQDVLQVLSKYFNNHTDITKTPKVDIFQNFNEKGFNKPHEEHKHRGLPFAQRTSTSENTSQADRSVNQQSLFIEKYWNEFANMMKSAFEKDSDSRPLKQQKKRFKKQKHNYRHVADDSDIVIKYKKNAVPTLDMVWEAGDLAENKDIMWILAKSLEHVLSTYLDRRVDCDVRDSSFIIRVNNSYVERISEEAVLQIVRELMNNNEYRGNVFRSVVAKLQNTSARLDGISIESVDEAFNTIFQNDPFEITITLPKGRR